jgi:hypothetical protein
MGTNFYHETGPAVDYPFFAPAWEPERRHIGKSSYGWCFSLHVYPDEGIHDLPDWEKLWAKGGRVVDEYDDKISIEEMRERITDRSHPAGWDDKNWTAGNHYTSEEHMLRMNHAFRGPNNLLRHQLMEGHCIGNGAGTWDLIIGDFS